MEALYIAAKERVEQLETKAREAESERNRHLDIICQLKSDLEKVNAEKRYLENNMALDHRKSASISLKRSNSCNKLDKRIQPQALEADSGMLGSLGHKRNADEDDHINKILNQMRQKYSEKVKKLKYERDSIRYQSLRQGEESKSVLNLLFSQLLKIARYLRELEELNFGNCSSESIKESFSEYDNDVFKCLENISARVKTLLDTHHKFQNQVERNPYQ